MITPQAVSLSQGSPAARFLDYLRTGRAPEGLFAHDVVASIHVGGGHYEVRSPRGLEAELQQYGGPIQTEVLGQAETRDGFVLEFTQRAPSGDVYEEMAWVTLDAGQIRQIRWYCTGIVRGVGAAATPV